MDTFNRRNSILSVLIERGHETIDNLAQEFQTSTKTIRRDVEILSLGHPITTKAGRYYGGIYYDKTSRTSRRKLNLTQTALLSRLVKCGREASDVTLTQVETEVLQSILREFS